ncbi:MAG: DNA polymerase III subunit beta, partial [Verrucomicrobia bacterium]|nr:DNA polymerase III subunit beta [Verrucomicrobiota bacterium]
MKLTIAKEQIISGLQAVQNIVSTRTTLPILSNVLMRADEKQLELTATDLDVSISCAVEAAVSKPGATTLPVRRLFSIVRELPALEIELEVDEKNVCALKAGASFYRINGLGAEEFPPLPKFTDDKKVAIPQDKLRAMLRKTAYAVSMDEARYVLNGIFFVFKEHLVTLVATDGRRLALAEEEVEVSAAAQGEFIVPTKAINELVRLVQSNGEVQVKHTQNQVSFTLRDDKGFTVLVASKLVDGTYPNYRQVIPAESKERIALPREELLQALHRAEIM